MEVQNLNNKPEEKMRLEQTAIYGQGIHLPGEELDDIDI